ncbi:MAG: hypothetical protein ACKO8Q_03885, partial [Bacteroidota bacterium]
EVDAMSYNESMHFDLLNSFDGVSLERINFQVESSNSNSWQSASYAVGYATPGYLNSQYTEGSISNGTFEVTNTTFSPDNDGFEDVIGFTYNGISNGSIGNITLFNERGIRVKRLMRNEYLGESGVLYWEGTSDDGEALSIGIYFAKFEVFAADGSVSEKLATFVLAKKL